MYMDVRLLKKLLLAGLALLCIGCSPVVRVNDESVAALSQRSAVSYNEKNYPVTIENLNSKAEKEERVYRRPPARAVCVWQNSIETLIALGVGDRIVGGMGIPDKKYLLPENQSAYEKIPYTSRENLAVENVLLMEPELVVGWHSTFSPKVLRGTDFWHQRGVETYIAPNSVPGRQKRLLEYEYQDILNLGRIFDREERAKEIVAKMQAEIDFVAKQTQGRTEKPRALCIEFMSKDISVYGERTLVGDIMRRLGADHLAAKELKLSNEQIIELDPDAIFVVIIESSYGNEDMYLDRIRKHVALRNLRCVRENRIYPLPLYAIYSAGVRSYDGIKIIARGLYPELYREAK